MSKKSNRAFADAIWLGDWESAQSIYATGDVDLNQPDSDTGLTWLHFACRMGNPEFARWLLNEGVCVDAPVVRGNDDPDDNDPDDLGATALMLTVDSFIGQRRKLIDMLLAAGADINATDSFGQNVVHRALNSRGMLKLVLNRGADPDVRAHNGDTPLMRASLMGEKHAIKKLRKGGASEEGMLDVNFLNACFFDKRDKINEYLVSGANVNFQRNGTALSAAARRADIELMRLLLDAGADIDLAESNMPGGDFNPLLSAAYDGQIDVVRFLLDAGADVTVSNQGYTALKYAKLGKAEGRKPDRPWDEVATMIRDAGKSDAATLRGRVVKKGACEAVDALNAVLPGHARWSRFVADGVEIIESNRIDDTEFLRQELPAMQTLVRSYGFNLALIEYSLEDVEPRLSDLSREFAAASATSATDIFDAWEVERLGSRSDTDDDDEDSDAYDWSHRQKVLAELNVTPATSTDAPMTIGPGHLTLCAGGVTSIPIIYQFGGWNSAPRPIEMGLVLQHWADTYNAELISIGRDTLAVRLEDPLRTLADVRAAAREIGLFCDESESAEDDIRTATSNYWAFWWD